jgi:carbon monoxide dehydrogenase subunit G
MDFHGRYAIPAPPDVVWSGLNDPDVLKQCIPGCEQIEKTSPTDFVATATLKIGPVKATFKGKVSMSELDPPSRCVLSGEGQGGMAGFAKGNAEVRLAPDNGGTVLTYTARATVGGKLAQIGQRLIDGAAKQIADDFFGRFAARLSAPPEAAEQQSAGAALEAEPASEVVKTVPVDIPESTRREGVAPEIWVVGLIAVVVILLLLFGVAL